MQRLGLGRLFTPKTRRNARNFISPLTSSSSGMKKRPRSSQALECKFLTSKPTFTTTTTTTANHRDGQQHQQQPPQSQQPSPPTRNGVKIRVEIEKRPPRKDPSENEILCDEEED